ncbi:hypothetical protein L841_2544 [Mycobacterium sp. MAC_080597_8934]|nr:hypothetical protein L841_2544 [Mycobacterium sp. MAC_080597_8934]
MGNFDEHQWGISASAVISHYQQCLRGDQIPDTDARPPAWTPTGLGDQ